MRVTVRSLFAMSSVLLLSTSAMAGVETYVDAYSSPRLLVRSMGTGSSPGFGLNNCHDLRAARLSINDRGEVALISTCHRTGSTRDYFILADAEGGLHQSRLLPLNTVGSRVSTDDSGQFTYAVAGSAEAGVYAFDSRLGYGSSSHRLLTRQPDGACARLSPTRLADDRVRFIGEMCAGASVTSRAVIESDGLDGAGQVLMADAAWLPAGEFYWIGTGGRSANGWMGTFLEFYTPDWELGHEAAVALYPGQSARQWRSWSSSTNRLPGALDPNQAMGFGLQGDGALLSCNGSNCHVFMHFAEDHNVIRWSSVLDREPEGVPGIRPDIGHPPAVRRAGAALHVVGAARTLPVNTGEDVLVTIGAHYVGPAFGTANAWKVLLREGDLIDTDLGPARIKRRTGGKAFYNDAVMNSRGDLVVVVSLKLESTGNSIGEGVFLMTLDRLFQDGFEG